MSREISFNEKVNIYGDFVKYSQLQDISYKHDLRRCDLVDILLDMMDYCEELMKEFPCTMT